MKNVLLLSALALSLQSFGMQLEAGEAAQDQQQIDDSCVICLEPLGRKKQLRAPFVCKSEDVPHFIHRRCYNPKINECPMCRASKAEADVEDSFGLFEYDLIDQRKLQNWRNSRAANPNYYKHLELISAVNNQDSNRINELLADESIQLNVRDNIDETALAKAVEKGRFDIVQALIEHGADVDTKNIYEQTPLMKAVLLGHEDIANMLIDNDASINNKDIMSETILMVAAANGLNSTVNKLLDADVSTEEKDCKGRRAIRFAAKYGHRDVYNTLMAAGSKPGLRDRFRIITR